MTRICADCYGCLSWDSGCAKGMIIEILESEGLLGGVEDRV